MKKLLGVREVAKNIRRMPSIPSYQRTLKPPPPLPAEFKVSAFTASRIDEYKEDEKKRQEKLDRLIESKKETRFRKISQKMILFQGNKISRKLFYRERI